MKTPIAWPCAEPGGDLKGESPKLVFTKTAINKNRGSPMKESQNTNLNASVELPNFAGMSLLAILRQKYGMLLTETIEAEITERLGRLR